MVPPQADVREFVKEKCGDELCLTLPNTFDDYWRSVHKDVRTQVRKAQRSGYTAFQSIDPQQLDIGAIWRSHTERQGRKLNPYYCPIIRDSGFPDLRKGWPFLYYEATRGYLDFYEVTDDEGVTVAYAEVASSDGDSIFISTLGHAAHLAKGVMRLLFVEVVRSLISRGGKHLYYLSQKWAQEHPERAYFARDLGFKEKAA